MKRWLKKWLGVEHLESECRRSSRLHEQYSSDSRYPLALAEAVAFGAGVEILEIHFNSSEGRAKARRDGFTFASKHNQIEIWVKRAGK
jgi:hypothetical protein